MFPLTRKRGSARAPLLHGVLYLLCVDTRDMTLQKMRAPTLLYSTLQTLQTLLYLTLQNLSLPRTPARWPFFRLPGAHQQRFCHRQNLESKEPGVWRGVSVLPRAPALPPTALSPSLALGRAAARDAQTAAAQTHTARGSRRRYGMPVNTLPCSRNHVPPPLVPPFVPPAGS